MEEINDSMMTLQTTIDAIRNNDKEKLEKLIGMMPLEKIKVEKSDSLLNIFLNVAVTLNRKEMVKLVIEKWREVYEIDEKLPFLANLMINPMYQVGILKFVMMVFPDYPYLEFMDDLIDYDLAADIPYICQKAIEVYGEQKRAVYEVIRDIADEKNNYLIYNFIISKLEKTADYAPVPKWVKNFLEPLPIPGENEIEIPKFEKPKYHIPNVEQSVEILTEGLESLGISIEDIDETKKVLGARLSIATDKDKIELLNPIMEKKALNDKQQDIELFRLLGPDNPIIDADLNSLKNYKYRMFLCDIFDYDDEIDDYNDWFNGVCEQCHLRIKERWHSVRMPNPTGGWKGCYCSIECLTNALNNKEIDDGNVELATRNMIDYISVTLNENGIQDRISK